MYLDLIKLYHHARARRGTMDQMRRSRDGAAGLPGFSQAVSSSSLAGFGQDVEA